MNIISKLTVRHLLGNRKRTVVTVLGIATSTALISAIILGVFSFFKFFGYLAIQTDGNVHAEINEVSYEQFMSLKEDERIATAGVRDVDADKSGIRLPNDKEDRFRIGNIEFVDEDYMSMTVVTDYDGVLPKDSSQIAVEEQFLIDNGLEDLKLGDSLTFEQGYRYIDDELEGFYYLGGNYRSDEKFKAMSTETCTVTAILHGNKPTGGWDIIRGMDEGFFPDKDNSQVFIRLKKCDHTAIKQIKSIVADHGIEKYGINSEYLLSVFAFEGSAGTYKQFFVIMAIALVIVIVTSVILIFNSIGMSLTERMRYLGMLASVGATARQKRFSIYYEGLILGLIGIPLGLLLGYIGTKITLILLGSKILEADMIVAAMGMRGGIPISCDFKVLAAIVILSAVTILISTFVPAIKAAGIMPIDALRQSSVVKVRSKKLRVNPLIRKIFGYEGELAYKNIKRNGVKGTVITVTISVSVILFLVINYFCQSVTRANQFELDLPYQLVASCSVDQSDMLREAISGMEGVTDVYSACMIDFPFKKSPDSKVVLANKDITDPKFLLPGFSDLEISDFMVLVIDDEDFNQILAENGLEKGDYYKDTLRGVILNDFFHEKKPSEIFNNDMLGQVLHYDEKEGFPPAIEVGAFTKYNKSNKIYDLVPKGYIAIFVPSSMYYDKACKVLPGDRLTKDLGVETSRHRETYDSIYKLFEGGDYRNYYCSDLTDTIQIMDTVTLMLKTAMYGFTILLTLIAIANIVNTISTGVLLRRKEFAMYKSVGLAAGGFKKMIKLEVLLYGIKALILGIPVSLFLSFMMYNAFTTKLYTFSPDWLMYLAVVAAVFGILGISMALSINKIKDDNIIEALKEDAV